MTFDNEKLTIRNCRIANSNFAGKSDPQYNTHGLRSFRIIFGDGMSAQYLKKRGFAVKATTDKVTKRPCYIMRVFVEDISINAFGAPDPRVIRIVGNNATTLGSDELAMLDTDHILNCDIKIKGAIPKNNPGKRLAYADTAYITVEKKDDLDAEYAYLNFTDKDYLKRSFYHEEEATLEFVPEIDIPGSTDEIARNIRCHRKAMRLTQHELATKIGVSNPMISLWETGKTTPTYARLEELADIFDVDVKTLCS